MGAVEGKLIEQMVRDGQPLPDKIANAPRLGRGLDLYYIAFQDLSSCRNVGMAVGPIPWTAIKLYCDEHKIKGEQRDDVFFLVAALDEAYREHVQKDSDKRTKKGLK